MNPRISQAAASIDSRRAPRSPRLAWLQALALAALLLSLALAVHAAEPDEDDAELAATEIRIGREASQAFRKTVRLTTQGADVTRLRRILARLAPHSGRVGLPYKVDIVESPQINAITFPGGQIYVFRGILRPQVTDAMLAGLLAHEIAHAARSHGYRTMLSNRALGVVTGGQGLGQTLLLRGVGRTYELQADRLALQTTRKAGYDARAMISLLEMLNVLGRNEPGVLSGLTATHPPLKVRIQKVRTELQRLP